LFSRLLEFPQVNQYLAGQITALDYAYPPKPGAQAHPLVGTRVPDLVLRQGDGTGNLYEHLRDATHVLLTRTDDTTAPALAPVPGALHVVRGWPAEERDGWEDADAVLIRPDGHVAAVR
ncbi:monooxygenase, partial [Streptomyces sp. MCAF7]